MYINLAGLTVLVTGASRGIGHAIASRLGEAGATIAAHYSSHRKGAEGLVYEIGNDSKSFKADLSNMEEVRKLFIRVMDEYEGIDVLINNAGVAIKSDPGKDHESWLSDWEKTMAVNLTAPALLSKMAVQHFLKRGGGRIINISSRAAFRGDTMEYQAYAASKGGLVSLTRSLARAYGKQGVKAFNIAPGFTKTDMAQDFIDAYGEDFATKDIALERLTEPKDIAPLVVFLASGMADHATGGTFDMNAGSYVH